MEEALAWRDRYFEYLQFEKRYSAHTLTAYRIDLEQFFDFCAVRRYNPLQCDFRRVRQWLVSLPESGMTARTVNRKITTLRGFFRFLLRRGAVSANPMEKSSLMKTGRRLPTVVAADRLRQLFARDLETLEFAELRDLLIVETLYFTGMRCAEMIGLDEQDVDLKQLTVRVTGKRDKQRLIPLAPSFAGRLGYYLQQKRQQAFSSASGAFFVLDSGSRLYAGKVYRVCRDMLYNVTMQDKRSPHVLRHSFATHMLENHAALDAIKTLLGHAGLAATQVYTHNSLQTIKTVYKQAHPRA